MYDPESLLHRGSNICLCAFLTPIKHQNNTLILGPGGLRFLYGYYTEDHRCRYQHTCTTMCMATELDLTDIPEQALVYYFRKSGSS